MENTTSAIQVVNLLLNHGETLKEAGMLDSVAKSGPAWLKPIVQKMIIKMKYPEFYNLMKLKSNQGSSTTKKYKDIVKLLGGKNKDLFQRALDVEAKLYGGKGTTDMLRRQIPFTPPYNGF